MASQRNRADDALRAMGATAAPPPPLAGRVEAILATLRPVSTSSPLRALAATTAASLVVAAAHVVVFGLRADFASLRPGRFLFVALVWAAGFSGMLALVMVPKRGRLLPDPWRIFGANVLGPLGLIAFGAASGGAPAALVTWAGHLHQDLVCLFTGLEIAVAPVLGAALAMRYALPVETRALGAALGAAGGALGALVLHFRCGFGGALHVGLAHGGTALVGAALGGTVLPHLLTQ